MSAAPAIPSKKGPGGRTEAVVLGLDYGTRRIGVAVGQALTGTASPLATVPVGPGGPDWEALEGLVRRWRPQALVLGMPGGPEHPLAGAVRGFARGLRRRLGLPVHLVDERLSSLEAARRLRGRRAMGESGGERGTGGRAPWREGAKARLDREAACVILETWLAEQATTGRQGPPPEGPP